MDSYSFGKNKSEEFGSHCKSVLQSIFGAGEGPQGVEQRESSCVDVMRRSSEFETVIHFDWKAFIK